ncbi:type VI secretion system-associated protein TagF [Denitromonas iodatirespirans]|uniref:Type VI secretion system-associated protein TagF n=1 Tax=Denitromonas iodatirespirans TaxID=2795389 RepID=A0A944D7X1_DENI1|nr:type VI secretion system-associated protein TagF [Denitromonas iodatirespirans]MBT0960207.1 type VI secretion system-associated protein TagF [Denitromonas iodatirespirans]
MTGASFAPPATCFGKLPSRGDFVKGPNQHGLISMLDRWVSSAMELLSDDPRWKQAYDAAPAVDFAFVGARSRVSVIGHLRPSQDASGRRFPFLTVATIERDDTLMFRCAPAGLSRPFGNLRGIARSALAGSEVAQVLSALSELDCSAEFSLALGSDPLGNYVRRTTLAAFAERISPPLSADAVRRIILAIGLLMRPLLGNGASPIDKALVLPLPDDERDRNIAASLWLYLITAFLRQSGAELQVLIARDANGARLVVGFNGASARTLLAVMSPDTAPEHLIVLDDPEWIEQHDALSGDYGVAKLSSYLHQPTLTLEAAVSTFREVFLGE